MAKHIRKQIRDRALATLTGLQTTQENVFAARVTQLTDAELPALKIDTLREQIAVGSMGAGRLVERTLSLVVVAVVQELDDYADTLDQIINEVEIALAADQDLGGIAKYVQLISIEIVLDGETHRPIGEAEMTFEVLYYTALDAPDVAH